MNAWEAAAEQFEIKVDYRADPARWAQERAGVHLWSTQVEIHESVRDNANTAVHSCHSAGKSFSAASVACWWIDSHPPGEAFVVSSAPTGDQVKAILWREIGRLHKAGGLPGRTNLTEWYIGGELVAMGRKPNDYEPTAFQGIHALYVLVILDEACGIPTELWDAASTLTSNAGGRVLAIGNPDDPHGEFARKCAPGNQFWNVIHIGAWDTPNFTGEEVPERVASSLLSQAWVDEKRIQWGEGSALYTSKVLGLFPTDSESGVIPLSFIERCRELDAPAGLPIELGVDVGAGGDESVITVRAGKKFVEQRTSRHDDPMKLVGEVLTVIRETGATRCKIDVIGVGWGIAGRLIELFEAGEHECEVVKVNVGEASNFPDRFANKRAELWWEVGREMSRTAQWDLAAVDDMTVAELTAHDYEVMDSKGKVKVQKKDDVRKKLGRSPDRADSLLLSFYTPYAPSASYGEILSTARLPGTDRGPVSVVSGAPRIPGVHRR